MDGDSDSNNSDYDFDEDITPVMDLDVSSDDATDDDLSSEDDFQVESEDEEAKVAAIEKENKLLTAWGKKKSAFYDHDQDVEIDDEAAAAEEEEARRLQALQTAELDEDDIAFGYSVIAAKKGMLATSDSSEKGADAKTKSKKVDKGRAVQKIDRDTTQLSKTEKLEILLKDAPELIGLVEEMKEKMNEVKQFITPILDAYRNKTLPHAANEAERAGLSYLEVKHQLLLAYITNVSFYLLLRAEGKSVKDHPVISQLVHIKALLDRMRPLDSRMSHQINRLLKSAQMTLAAKPATGVNNEESDMDDVDYSDVKNHPKIQAIKVAKQLSEGQNTSLTASRPNPLGLLVHGDKKLAVEAKAKKGMDEDLEDEFLESDSEGDDDGVYKAIRRTAVPFDVDGARSKAEKALERSKKRLAKSALLRDLKQTFSDAPEQADVDGVGGGAFERNAKDEALDRISKERAAHEEETFTRLNMSKEERKARRARERERQRWDSLAELESFGDMDAFSKRRERIDEGVEEDVVKSSKGRKNQLDAEIRAKERTAGGVASSARDGMADGFGKKRTGSATAAGMELGGLDSDDGFGFGGDDEDMWMEAFAGKRGRKEESEVDPFYARVAAAAANKKAKRAEAKQRASESTAEYLQSLPDESEDLRGDGKRKISKEIMTNRGLMKYRKKEERNPRVHNRLKAAKQLKRRVGQAAPMRDKAAEEGRYAGETTGIRSAISRSRIIKS